jgi:hypothetical protein
MALDEAGLGVLRALLAQGVAVSEASPYVRLLLELEELKKPHEPPSRRKRRTRAGQELASARFRHGRENS